MHILGLEPGHHGQKADVLLIDHCHIVIYMNEIM